MHRRIVLLIIATVVAVTATVAAADSRLVAYADETPEKLLEIAAEQVPTTCPKGQFLRNWDGFIYCRTCLDCTPAYGFVEVQNCTFEHDRICHCKAGMYCPDLSYITCREPCVTCEHGTYQPNEDLKDECIPWRYCHGAVTFPGNATADRECDNPCIRSEVTKDGKYFCEQCTTGYKFDAGVYDTEPETAKSCTKCPDNTYSTGVIDFQCSPCRRCSDSPLTVEVEACKSGTDAVCNCAEDSTCMKYDEHHSCLICVVTCGPGQYRDSQHAVCLTCPPGTFSTTEEAASCAPWTVCSDDEIIASPGTNRSDVLCAKCPEGQYPSDNKCVPWTKCEQPEIEILAGTQFHDAVCVNCGNKSQALNRIAAVKTEFERDRAVQNYVQRCATVPEYKFVYGMTRYPWWMVESYEDAVITCIALGPQNNSVPDTIRLKDHFGAVVASCRKSGYECDGDPPNPFFYKNVKVRARWEIASVLTRDDNGTRQSPSPMFSQQRSSFSSRNVTDDDDEMSFDQSQYDSYVEGIAAFNPNVNWNAYHIMYMTVFRLYAVKASMAFQPVCEFVNSDGTHAVTGPWLGISSRPRPSVFMDNVHMVIRSGWNPPLCECGGTKLYSINRTHVSTISTSSCTVNCSNVDLQNAAVVNLKKVNYDRRGYLCHTQPITTAAGLMYCYKSDMYNWEYASYPGQAISGAQCIRNKDGTYRSYFKSGDNMFFCKVHTPAGWEWASPPPITIGTFAQYYTKHESVYGVGVCSYLDVSID